MLEPILLFIFSVKDKWKEMVVQIYLELILKCNRNCVTEWDCSSSLLKTVGCTVVVKEREKNDFPKCFSSVLYAAF